MENILLIEDDPSTRIRFANIFHRKGFSVRVADTLSLGLEMFMEEAPDCIIMDLHFPEGHAMEDFYTELLYIQECRGNSPCPIVVLTASDAYEDLTELVSGGVYAIHNKNDSADDIAETIRREIGKTKFSRSRLPEEEKPIEEAK